MHIALLSSEGLPFLLRWIHFMAGVTWIGLLYYFNFVQGPFFAETDAAVKTGATQKLVPRALWWFRWGAMGTFLSGLCIIIYKIIVGGMAVMATSWGAAISVGAILGTLMFLNVWLIIWPNQRIVIAKANGEDIGSADPVAAGNRAFVASRTNTLFSIPMLFMMGAASHLTLFGAATMLQVATSVGIVCIFITIFEVNAILGKKNEGLSMMIDKHVNTIYAGLLLAFVFYFVLDAMIA